MSVCERARACVCVLLFVRARDSFAISSSLRSISWLGERECMYVCACVCVMCVCLCVRGT